MGPLLLAAALAVAPTNGETLQVDRLRVEGVTDPAKLDMLKDDHSLTAAADHLKRLGMRFTRAIVAIRTVDLPGGLVAQLKGLPSGEPFVLPTDGGVTVNALLPDDGAVATGPVWQPVIPGEPTAAQLAAARRFVDVAIPPADRAHFFDRTVDNGMATMTAGLLRNAQLGTALQAHPTMRPIFARFLAQQRELALADFHTHLPQLIEAQTIAYARLFSAEELNRLAAFFGQPLGRKYIQQSLLLQAQPELSAWQQGVIARAQSRIPAEVQQLMTEMQAALAKEKTTHDL